MVVEIAASKPKMAEILESKLQNMNNEMVQMQALLQTLKKHCRIHPTPRYINLIPCQQAIRLSFDGRLRSHGLLE